MLILARILVLTLQLLACTRWLLTVSAEVQTSCSSGTNVDLRCRPNSNTAGSSFILSSAVITTACHEAHLPLTSSLSGCSATAPSYVHGGTWNVKSSTGATVSITGFCSTDNSQWIVCSVSTTDYTCSCP